MGRSVNYRSDAAHVWYMHNTDTQDDWEDLLLAIRATLKLRYGSLFTCDRWAGREEHIILENDLAEITICEYGGLVSLSLSPKTDYADHPELANHWCDQVVPGMTKALSSFDLLVKLGTFSNGESCYKRVD